MEKELLECLEYLLAKLNIVVGEDGPIQIKTIDDKECKVTMSMDYFISIDLLSEYLTILTEIDASTDEALDILEEALLSKPSIEIIPGQKIHPKDLHKALLAYNRYEGHCTYHYDGRRCQASTESGRIRFNDDGTFIANLNFILEEYE